MATKLRVTNNRAGDIIKYFRGKRVRIEGKSSHFFSNVTKADLDSVAKWFDDPDMDVSVIKPKPKKKKKPAEKPAEE